jgi:hypothetical protein
LSPLRLLSALSLGFALCCCDDVRLESLGKLCVGSGIKRMRWRMANSQSHFARIGQHESQTNVVNLARFFNVSL